MISDVDLRDWEHIKITLIKENEDGSADYTLHTTPEGAKFLMSYAFISVLKDAIKQGEQLTLPNDQPGT